jgi:hypothetical protein
MRCLQLLLVLLLSVGWSVAQDSPATSPTQTSPSGMTATSGQTGSDSASGDMTVQGCLSSSGGNYVLTDKSGTSYQLTGDNAKLSEHVGHEIQISGTGGAPGATKGGNTGESMGQTNSSTQQSLQVSSVKHISKTCTSGTTH